MKRCHFFAVIIPIIFNVVMLNAQDYQLVWSDEFNSTEINSNYWSHETGGDGWGNNELQNYTSRSNNSYIDNGMLIIKAIKENYGSNSYTSARLKTQGKKFWQYGKIEARIKTPYGKGIWPAFWMLGERFSSVGWPACGEIDIMELVGGTNGDNTVHGTIHWEDNGHQSWGGGYTLGSGVFADDFYVFSVTWTPEKIQWYIDGQYYRDADIKPSGLSEFHDDFFIILNMAVGGDWPGSPNGNTVFPQTMAVDYVRVYQDATAAPEINLIEPGTNGTFPEGTDIPLAAEVDFSGVIEKVEFYQDVVKIGETTLSPYRMNWRNVHPGSYKISAKAITEGGYEAQSQTVTLQVGDNFTNAPFRGYAGLVPGTVEAENYDLGGPNVAYYDGDTNNNGSQYRTNDRVDIESCSDIDGGYNVGWTGNGEWLLYTVDVHKAGTYNFDVRVAAENPGGSFHIEVDGVDKTGTFAVPGTGGWQDWETVTAENIELTSGTHRIKFFVESQGFNFNKMDIFIPGAESEVTIIEPNGGEDLPASSVQEIRWYRYPLTDVKIQLSTDGGSSWSDIASRTSSEFGVIRWLVPDIRSENCLIKISESKYNTQVIDISDGTFSIGDPLSIKRDNLIATDFILKQNYPNPFNPNTRIRFSLPEGNHVILKVYNLAGEEVAALVDNYINSGTFEVNFDASNLPTGTYFYSINAGSFKSIKKMVLIK